MNLKQITCVNLRYHLSNLCCLPPEKCSVNLHDNSKSNMAAIVNKVYSTRIAFHPIMSHLYFKPHNGNYDTVNVPGLAFTQVKNIWLGCCAPGSFMAVWRLPEAPFTCIRPIPLSCALRNSAFGLQVRVISRYSIADSIQYRISTPTVNPGRRFNGDTLRVTK